jgi:hypothetical protein
VSGVLDFTPAGSKQVGGNGGPRFWGKSFTRGREVEGERQLIGPLERTRRCPRVTQGTSDDGTDCGEGSNSRRKPATGVRIRGKVARPFTQRRVAKTTKTRIAPRPLDAPQRFGRSWGERIATPTISSPSRREPRWAVSRWLPNRTMMREARQALPLHGVRGPTPRSRAGP